MDDATVAPLSVNETAELLAVTSGTVLAAARAGTLRPLWRGGIMVFDQETALSLGSA